ncbi:MAG: endolytic transglycosylase MltG [Deltaproteobacteria bacterium]|nr:endolytic transglycosylase MltG [Deltaproteobacteria bacterium]
MQVFKPKKIIISLSAIVIFAGALAITGIGHYLTAPKAEHGDNRVFIIQNGMNLRNISESLEKEGLIRSSLAFMIRARFKGLGRMIKAGEYSLNPSMTPERIMWMITRGEVVAYNVTIPEGFTIAQIAEVVSSYSLITKEEFLQYVNQDGIERMYGLKGPGLEGYLYPDTYRFARGLNAKAIVDTMIMRFRAITEPLEDRLLESGMGLHDVVTLASIVEKETGNPDERPLIASVFLNRLKKNMRLDSDPTVIYGMKDFTGNIRKKDLTAYSPYNTYVIRGLPPGPIANPGYYSIKAVLFPADTEFLYFVSKNDGSHHFSKGIAEHNRAVRIYQKKRG